MTINSETRVAGPFDGNDSTVSFPFTFKVFDSDEVRVVAETGAVETDLELGTDYTVVLNADQNAAPGGSVVLAAPLATGTRLTLTSALEMLQPVDLTNQGGFYPRVINSALDRLTILLQQLASVVSRTLKFPLSDGPVGDLPGRSARAGTVLAFDEATGEPVAGPDIASVNGVVGALEAINTVSDNIVDVNTVAGNITDVNTVADNIADVNTVAGSIADVNTVAGSIADVNTVADNIVDVTNFSDVYYGPSASAPTTRRDGTPLQEGDLHFNTTAEALRVYDGSTWREATGGSIAVKTFSGDGSTVAFELDAAPANATLVQVFIDGEYQHRDTYTVVGTTLTFDAAPPPGTNNIEVTTTSTVPSDDVLRGELAETIDVTKGAALVARGAQFVGSVSDLRALSKLAASNHAFVAGYYTPGDGGGGAYYLDEADTTSADNGGTVIVAADGARWKLAQTARISVKQFGAKGDGVTIDDAAINAALAHAESVTGGAIHFPAGIYQVTNIEWDIETLSEHGSRVALTGDGPALSVIRSNTLANIDQGVMSVIARYETAMNSLIAGVEFSNLGFESQNGNGVSFRTQALAYCYFENCHFNGGQFAFFGVGLVSSSFTNCRFSWATEAGLRLQKGVAFSYPNAITLTQCVIGNNSKYGIYADNPGGIRMFGGSVEGNGSGAVDGTGAGVVLDHAAVSAGTAIAAAFYGVYFEFNHGRADVYLVHNNTSENVSLTVADSSFACGGANITTNRILVEHLSSTALNVNVHGCNFQELGGYVPTTSNRYIKIDGPGTGVRVGTGFGNYFNHPNAFPVAAQFRELPRSNQARIESQVGAADANGEVTFTFPAFAAPPSVVATPIDSGAGVVTIKCIGRTATTVTLRAQFTTTAGGAWSAGAGMNIAATIIGT